MSNEITSARVDIASSEVRNKALPFIERADGHKEEARCYIKRTSDALSKVFDIERRDDVMGYASSAYCAVLNVVKSNETPSGYRFAKAMLMLADAAETVNLSHSDVERLLSLDPNSSNQNLSRLAIQAENAESELESRKAKKAVEDAEYAELMRKRQAAWDGEMKRRRELSKGDRYGSAEVVESRDVPPWNVWLMVVSIIGFAVAVISWSA